MSYFGFIPDDVVSQVKAMSPEQCPYCLAYPSIPCGLHAENKEVTPEKEDDPRGT